MPRRTLAIVALAALLTTTAAAPAAAGASTTWPTVLPLPAGFQPEGIAIGDEPYAYFGSRVDGDIYRVSLRTGEGATLAEGPGTASLGLKLDDRGRLFVAGGAGGDARVLDAATGRTLKSYELQEGTAFINDETLTCGAAWFTDSANPVLFKLPLGRRGVLPAEAERIPLTGDIVYATGNNANGIAPTPDGRALIIVQSNTGKIFKTGYDGTTTEIDLGGESVVNGDGLWLRGKYLYVVQNRANVITKIKLDRSATSGEVVSRTTDPNFDVPTTIAAWGTSFYLPNARFTTTPTPETEYTAVRVERP